MIDNLIFILGIALLLLICVIALVLLARKLLQTQEELKTRIKLLTDMNNNLRENRHDYLNTMQIVYGMVELEEYDELKDYLEPMYQDIMKTSKALKTSMPAVNALLMAKMSESDQAGINFFVEVKSNLRNLDIAEWELCRILSNLIDNAFRAVKESDKDNRVIVDINETKENILFTITDFAKEIPAELQQSIFQPGFTTKKEEGHGMGLSIVSKLVAKNSGDIKLRSDKTETSFTITFPKKEVE